MDKSAPIGQAPAARAEKRKDEVRWYFLERGAQGLWAHTECVAREIKRLAERFHLDLPLCESAAYYHDIACVMKPEEMLAAALRDELVLFDAERQFPSMLHQRVSACLARELFGLQNEEVLGAIACHTTLRENASPLDMALFVADKLAWEPKAPFYEEVEEAAKSALPAACLAYMRDMERRGQILLPHPWFLEAKAYLLTIT